MKPKNDMTMTNSTSISRRRGAARPSVSTVNDFIAFAAWLSGFLASAAAALGALVAWSSPLVFFSALAAALFCVDPLRRQWGTMG